MIRIAIAVAPYKDCLGSLQVARSLGRGIERVFGNRAEISTLPVADGGDGTIDALRQIEGSVTITLPATDPLGRVITAPYLWFPDKKRAIIEMALISGLALLGEGERDPLITSTFGTGELIRDALERGAERVLLGAGGSATNDAGAGAVAALGLIFRDREGNEFVPVGGTLSQVAEICDMRLKSLIAGRDISIMADVTNPLLGPNGCAAIYAPQKGAASETVLRLEREMELFARTATRFTGREVAHIPGSGAAGGLAAGLVWFCNASVTEGFRAIARETSLDRMLSDCDIVVTGEGSMDSSTFHGKAPYNVALLAKEYGKKVIAVNGVTSTSSPLAADIFDGIISLGDEEPDRAIAIERAEELLENAGVRAAKMMMHLLS